MTAFIEIDDAEFILITGTDAPEKNISDYEPVLRKAVQKLVQTLLLTSEFAYRSEFGVGEPDEYGRRMLPPREAAYAIAYALFKTGEFGAAERHLAVLTRADLFRKAAELRRAMQDCRKDRWKCL